eukprot:gene13461-4338_t
MAVTGKQKIGIILVIVVAVAVCVALICSVYSDLEYYEMGFVKDRFTGKVDRSKVYLGGRHYIGIGKLFKKFPKNMQILDFNLSVFNAEKLEVFISGVILYELNKDELKHLHDAYDLGYKPIVDKIALEAVKNAAPVFTVQEYRLQRSKVEAELYGSVKRTLLGTCCPKYNGTFAAVPGCKKYETCNMAEKGMFCIVKNFQLEVVKITKDQEDRYLRNVLEQEKLQTEQYKQQEKMERKVTEQLKTKISNEANEVAQKASAQSAYIKAAAQASAKAIKENARNSGLQLIYTTLNITNETNKKSLDYLRTLLNHKTGMFYVGFSTLIGREGNT